MACIKIYEERLDNDFGGVPFWKTVLIGIAPIHLKDEVDLYCSEMNKRLSDRRGSIRFYFELVDAELFLTKESLRT